MKPRYKVTGCARFFLFFIIFIPVVFFGAAYLRGENGMDELKNFYYKIVGKETPGREHNKNASDCEEKVKELKDENANLKRELREKENEIASLKKSVDGER